MHKENVAITKTTSKKKFFGPFTKTLPTKSFEGHLEGMELWDMSHLL